MHKMEYLNVIVVSFQRCRSIPITSILELVVGTVTIFLLIISILQQCIKKQKKG